ncbi:MAG: thioesterase family protein [Verrucomicrobia bacterium]|nr:thioesterase family protein [Verrucomicrobiota bacterium]MDA1068029.1 thioesterase family protein [Verrucomicrobiota bacterium]
MIRSETNIRVRYVETDAMGFAHHGNYFSWFELARIEMLDGLAMPYKQLEQDGYFLPVLDVSARYKQPAFFDDCLTIVCMVKEMPNVRIRIEYEVYREGTLLATGTSGHAFINKDGTPVRPPKYYLSGFKKAMTA